MSGSLVKRNNIVELGYRNVLKPLAVAADPFSWVLFVAFIALIAISIACKVFGAEDPESFYENHFLWFWYGSWGLLLCSVIGPIFNIAKSRNEIPLGVLVGVGVSLLVVFIGISVVVVFEFGSPQSVAGLMAAFAAAMMVGIGWVVQHQSSARTSRRAHTFNILMQSRLNKEFGEKVSQRASYYHSGRIIPVEDAPLATKKGVLERLGEIEDRRSRETSQAKTEFLDEINSRYDEEVALVNKKYESLQGVVYLLNFYEFMCAGICLRELDKDLLYASVASIVSGLYDDTVNLRAYCRQGQKTVFENLDKVMLHHWHRG